jgi:hypothetical protein
MIAFIAQLTGGAGEEALVTFVLGATPLVVCVLALVTGRAESGRAGLSAGCAVIAVAGIVLWQLTADPVLAVLFCIIADLFASLPTVVKAHVDRSSEYPLPYLLSATAMIVTLFTIQDWRFAVYGFPLYMLLINMVIFSVASFPVASTAHQTPALRRGRPHSPVHTGEPLSGST